MDPIINQEDAVGKTHGKRQGPDSLSAKNSTKKSSAAMQRALPIVFPKKGVYRFKTHEEADAWMLKETAKKSP